VVLFGPPQDVVSARALICGDEVGVKYGGEGGELFQVVVELLLQRKVDDLAGGGLIGKI
jgi:hypothetical protein